MTISKIARLPGLEAIWLGRYRVSLATRVWLFRIGDTLIDTGPSNQWKHVKKYAEKHQIKRAYITHHHEDHAGNAAYLHRDCGVELFGPQESLKTLHEGFQMEWFRRLFWGSPLNVNTVQPFPEKIDLGPEYGELVPIPAPGHCFDHTVLHLPQRGWLFSADLFVTSTPNYCRFDQDPVLEMESIRRVLDTADFDTIMCAHRGILTNGRSKLKARLEFFETVQHQVNELMDKYPDMTVREMTRRILGTNTDAIAYVTSLKFSKDNVIRSFVHK